MVIAGGGAPTGCAVGADGGVGTGERGAGYSLALGLGRTVFAY